MNDQSIARKHAAAPAGMPAELRAILGRPPLLRSESRAAYDALTARCAATLGPQDMIEWLMVADYIDLTWEILRLRRARQDIVRLAVPGAVYGIVHDLHGEAYSRDVEWSAKKAWIEGGEARKALCRQLANDDVDEGTIEAEALRREIDTVDKIERFLFQKEALRRAVLKDLDAYRARGCEADTVDAVAAAPALAAPAANGASGAA